MANPDAASGIQHKQELGSDNTTPSLVEPQELVVEGWGSVNQCHVS